MPVAVSEMRVDQSPICDIGSKISHFAFAEVKTIVAFMDKLALIGISFCQPTPDFCYLNKR